MQPKRQTVTLVSSVNPQKPKQMGLLGRLLALLPAKSVAQFSIRNNRNTLLLRSKNRFKANKLIEAQVNGKHLSSSRMRPYLHHSSSPLVLQTRRMFHIHHIKPVQGLGDDQTETLAASIL